MKPLTILFIVSLILPLIPMGIAEQWYFFYTWLTLCLGLGVWEIVAVKSNGKTITKRFKALRERSGLLFWLVMGSITFFWMMLMVHFLV